MKQSPHLFGILIIIIPLILPCIGFAQTFEEYKKQQEAEFKQYQEDYTHDYDEFEENQKAGIKALQKELENFWGEENTKLPSQKEWVLYSDDKHARKEVDFEKGNASVEILLTPAEAQDSLLVSNMLQSLMHDLIFDKCSVYNFEPDDDAEKDVLGESAVKNQIANTAGELVSIDNASAFLSQMSQAKNINFVEIKGSDGSTRIKAEVNIPLISDHMLVRAQKYKTDVKQFATDFSVPIPLIFAIIDTESSFNPAARSHIPAFGLMQIVPRFAGRDAYKHIYKKDTILSADYLYHPQNNIELGTAYFDKLMTHYFKGVENQECKMLCAVAAYNTGSRNFYKAFVEPSKNEIIQRINTMTYDELFVHLQAELPYAETRSYIVKVDQKIKQYQQWLNTNN